MLVVMFTREVKGYKQNGRTHWGYGHNALSSRIDEVYLDVLMPRNCSNYHMNQSICI